VFAPGSGYLVLFGTGRLIEAADLEPDGFAPQSLYALHDRPEHPPVPPAARAQLAERSVSGSDSGSDSYRIDGAAPDYGGPGAKQGWYFDFPHTASDRERLAGSPTVVSGTVIFSTLLPGADGCSAPSARTYVLGAVSGYAIGPDGLAHAGASTGLLTRGAGALMPMLFETLVHSAPAGAGGSAFATRTFTLMRAGSGPGAVTGESVQVRFPAGRLGWREVSNWPELHQAAIQ
jgi:type IV pilus assembly protein PilY1